MNYWMFIFCTFYCNILQKPYLYWNVFIILFFKNYLSSLNSQLQCHKFACIWHLSFVLPIVSTRWCEKTMGPSKLGRQVDGLKVRSEGRTAWCWKAENFPGKAAQPGRRKMKKKKKNKKSCFFQGATWWWQYWYRLVRPRQDEAGNIKTAACV